MVSHLLDLISEDMHVIDSEGFPVGKITHVRYGEGQIVPDLPVVLDILKDTLYETREFEPHIYIRMYSDGFLRISRGVLHPDFFVFPAQISEIRGNESIVLSVKKADLLEG